MSSRKDDMLGKAVATVSPAHCAPENQISKFMEECEGGKDARKNDEGGHEPTQTPRASKTPSSVYKNAPPLGGRRKWW
jgi:hypothetical protein